MRQSDVLGEDERLVSVLHQRLAELEVSTLDAELGVLVVAIVSSQAAANAHRAGGPKADGRHPVGRRDDGVCHRIRAVVVRGRQPAAAPGRSPW